MTHSPDHAERAAIVAAGLTKAQRDVLLAIRPGEERRAIDFKGSAARGLMWATRRRPPLTTMTLTAAGKVAWFRLSHDGCVVRASLQNDEGKGVGE